MSEGKYGRLPKPKDRSKGISVTVGDVSLKPTRESEWEEEGDEYHAHPKKKAEESAVAKASRVVSELAASVSRPWGKFLKGKDDDEDRP